MILELLSRDKPLHDMLYANKPYRSYANTKNEEKTMLDKQLAQLNLNLQKRVKRSTYVTQLHNKYKEPLSNPHNITLEERQALITDYRILAEHMKYLESLKLTDHVQTNLERITRTIDNINTILHPTLLTSIRTLFTNRQKDTISSEEIYDAGLNIEIDYTDKYIKEQRLMLLRIISAEIDYTVDNIPLIRCHRKNDDIPLKIECAEYLGILKEIKNKNTQQLLYRYYQKKPYIDIGTFAIHLSESDPSAIVLVYIDRNKTIGDDMIYRKRIPLSLLLQFDNLFDMIGQISNGRIKKNIPNTNDQIDISPDYLNPESIQFIYLNENRRVDIKSLFHTKGQPIMKFPRSFRAAEFHPMRVEKKSKYRLTNTQMNEILNEKKDMPWSLYKPSELENIYLKNGGYHRSKKHRKIRKLKQRTRKYRNLL